MKWRTDGKKRKQKKGRGRKKGAPLKFVFKSSFRPLCRRVIQILGFDRLSAHLLPCCVSSCSLVVVDVVVVVVVVGSLSIYDDDNDDNFKKQ